jgi:hypothetical protein
MASVRSRFLADALPVAVLVVVTAVAFVPAVLEAVGLTEEAAALGGDFPAFYGAGRIVLDGDIARLYDPVTQKAAQSGLHNEAGGFLYFAYPPFVAVAYSFIAWLPYGFALTVQILGTLGALAVALYVLAGDLGASRSRIGRVAVGCAACLAAYPVIAAVLGGQNTTVTVLLGVLAWWAVRGGRWFMAGTVVAAAMFKPQFGIIYAVALAAVRSWRAVLVAGAGSAVLYLGTAVLMGWGWIAAWLSQVAEFGDLNVDANGHLMVNIVGWIGNLTDGPWPAITAWGLVACVAVLSWAVLRKAGGSWVSFGVATAGMILVAPSALFYDAGIALVGAGVFATAVGARWPLFAIAVAASWSQLAAGSLGWSPLFILVAVIWVAEVFTLGRTDGVSQATDTLAVP